ncbi:MAG TPA: shikimate kinase [Pyrinomonadaceae bacterium]|jgi:shikimate kinase
MENTKQKIVLTGFMGVGKSSVARHLADLLGCEKIDLDDFIVKQEKQEIAQILKTVGERQFRRIETENLRKLLQANGAPILSLGGGTWTIAENRRMIKKYDFTSVWLESSFEHCWQNIKFSKKERPLAKNKHEARFLFDEREKIYCLADWHFIVKPGFTSFDTAKLIAEEVFCVI